MLINNRIGLLRRRAVWATGVIAALAVAAPVAEASADPTPALSLPALGVLPVVGGLPAFNPELFPFVKVAMGATVIGAVTNGPTAVCVSPVSCVTSTSP